MSKRYPRHVFKSVVSLLCFVLLGTHVMNKGAAGGIVKVKFVNVGFDNAGINDVGPNRPNVNGDRNRWFDPATFSKPAVGTIGNLPRNALRGPGYWRTDAYLFKRFSFGEAKELEFRIESVNLFNHVNLDLPDAFIGDPANPSANAGRITSTAHDGNDPQRNFQFALKLKF